MVQTLMWGPILPKKIPHKHQSLMQIIHASLLRISMARKWFSRSQTTDHSPRIKKAMHLSLNSCSHHDFNSPTTTLTPDPNISAQASAELVVIGMCSQHEQNSSLNIGDLERTPLRQKDKEAKNLDISTHIRPYEENPSAK